MADDKGEVRDINFRQVLPWTELFRGFQVALDPKKMLLAAAGILVMWSGWFILSWIFVPGNTAPDKADYEPDLAKFEKIEDESEKETKIAEAKKAAAAEYDRAVRQWVLLQGTGGDGGAVDPLTKAPIPMGPLRMPPWAENRGPNPYLLATGQSQHPWSARTQLKVLLEPLVKFFMPIKYTLQPEAGWRGHIYFLFVLLWTVATWALFGGAITRMAAVQLTRKEKIGISEALRFTWKRYVSYFAAPLLPLLAVVIAAIFLIVYGFLHLIPGFGDIVVFGIGLPLVLLAGLVMALLLVGLVGWPLMYATISVEGSDSFDALSRSYSYVYQCPWHYLWNTTVAVAYGAILVFFVGFMGSFLVYLGKWGVAQTPGSGPKYMNREPSYLFIHAPESFGWRELLLEGSPYADPVQRERLVNAPDADWYWHNTVGAYMVSFWIFLVFLLMVGFSYSYFWCSSTIIYLLMRRKVDDTDLDEIYLEEDEAEETYSAQVPAPAPAAAGNANFQMVEAPTLRPSTPPTSTPPAKPPESGSTARVGDGNPPTPPA
jgi:hypothetical protein